MLRPAVRCPRGGVGSAIVTEIERLAREHGVRELHLESSVNAEPFYENLRYRVETRGELRIAPGVLMAAVTMRKELHISNPQTVAS